jgi:hypothetical protein
MSTLNAAIVYARRPGRNAVDTLVFDYKDVSHLHLSYIRHFHFFNGRSELATLKACVGVRLVACKAEIEFGPVFSR